MSSDPPVFDIRIKHRISDIALDVEHRTAAPILAVTGPSGTGKTTLLNCVAGLIAPDHGHISVAGATLFDSNAAIDLQPQQRRAGYLFQDNRLFPHKRVAANLSYGASLAPPGQLWMSRAEVCEFLAIDHLLDRWPDTLSGGEARRVALGRALLAAPRFLLLDEPLISLDAERREEVLKAVERIRDELQIPILYVSHTDEDVARLTREILPLG